MRRRGRPARIADSRGAVALLALAALAACGDATGPTRRPAVVVAFLDGQGRLNTVRSSEEHVVTPVSAGVPFAAMPGAVVYLSGDSLRLYRLAAEAVEPLPVAIGARARLSAGAVSPDGTTLAFAKSLGEAVYLVLVDLRSGARDSMDVTGRADAEAAEQIVLNTPVFSPSGDTIAFLMPNPIAVQLMVFEVPTRRIEVHQLRVPVVTQYLPLAGWPRWLPDQTLRFVARIRTAQTVSDSLVVLRVFPRQPTRPVERVYAAAPPDSLVALAMSIFSFSADGRSAAFAMATSAGPGVFAMHQGSPRFETLVVGPTVQPRMPMLVP